MSKSYESKIFEAPREVQEHIVRESGAVPLLASDTEEFLAWLRRIDPHMNGSFRRVLMAAVERLQPKQPNGNKLKNTNIRYAYETAISKYEANQRHNQ